MQAPVQSRGPKTEFHSFLACVRRACACEYAGGNWVCWVLMMRGWAERRTTHTLLLLLGECCCLVCGPCASSITAAEGGLTQVVVLHTEDPEARQSRRQVPSGNATRTGAPASSRTLVCVFEPAARWCGSRASLPSYIMPFPCNASPPPGPCGLDAHVSWLHNSAPSCPPCYGSGVCTCCTYTCRCMCRYMRRCMCRRMCRQSNTNDTGCNAAQLACFAPVRFSASWKLRPPMTFWLPPRPLCCVQASREARV